MVLSKYLAKVHTTFQDLILYPCSNKRLLSVYTFDATATIMFCVFMSSTCGEERHYCRLKMRRPCLIREISYNFTF